MKVLPFLLLFSLIFFIGIADAKTIYVSSTGSNSDQKVINDALLEAANNPGSTVYLKSDHGPFVINGQIKIGSNTKLTGDSDTIVKVSEKTSQFFVDGVGVFGQLGTAAAKNIEIYGFSIDGNCDELPKGYANSGSGDHNAERLIELRGYTNDLGNNIRIHDMRLYDAFSDAIHIYYSKNVFCYNNFISNCQHSSIFYVCCFYSAMYSNEIFGITSDCARLDNCQNCKIYKNIFYSYTGDNSNGAYQGGQNGLQVGDQGHSHGGGSDKPYHTTNIEVYENTFANCGRTSIWIDAAGKTPSTNLYIHDNKYIGVPVVERNGTPVVGVNITESSSANIAESSDNVGVNITESSSANIAESSDNVSYNNTPSVELSEDVFKSILDILNPKTVDSAITRQSPENFDYQVNETEQGKIAGGIKILGFNNWTVIDNKTYISGLDDVIVKDSIIMSPSLKSWNGNISDIDKDMKIEIEKGEVKATLTATVKWYSIKKNSQGKSTKSYKYSHCQFYDTYSPAPEILKQPDKLKGIVYQYPTYFAISVPTNGSLVTDITYQYEDNVSKHIFLAGTQNKTEDGVVYTEYESLEHWVDDGDLQHKGDWVGIGGKYDPSKFNITASSPYKKYEVKDFDVVKKELPDRVFKWWFSPFICLICSLSIAIYFYLRPWLHR